MKKYPVSVGDRFGKLVVLSFSHKNEKDRYWLCRCDCGAVKPIRNQCLAREKYTKSCGCSKGEFITQGKIKHGMAESREYRIWGAMKRRCYVPKCDKFHLYGGRGIRVCDRWLHSFENFLADMGPQPSPKHSIDRYPDVNGHYEPDNCRWATQKEQMQNTRKTRIIVIEGKSMCIREASRLIGVNIILTTDCPMTLPCPLQSKQQKELDDSVLPWRV